MHDDTTRQARSNGQVIAIDGPAGAGKSTVARKLAEQLGFEFLDTGAMYRCVTLAVLRSGIATDDQVAVAELASRLRIELDAAQVKLNGEDVSLAIRTPEVASAIGTIADNLAVRKLLTQMQRQWTRGRCVVTEGRDQGTEVFYDARCKIFLVASSEERARRRLAEMADRGIQADYETILAQQNKRDREDASRPVGALRKADDAVEVSTDGLTLDDVVDQIKSIVAGHIDTSPPQPPGQDDREAREPVGNGETS